MTQTCICEEPNWHPSGSIDCSTWGFKALSKSNCERRLLASSSLSVCPSVRAWNKSPPIESVFVKFYVIFTKIANKCLFWFKPNKNNRKFSWKKYLHFNIWPSLVFIIEADWYLQVTIWGWRNSWLLTLMIRKCRYTEFKKYRLKMCCYVTEKCNTLS